MAVWSVYAAAWPGRRPRHGRICALVLPILVGYLATLVGWLPSASGSGTGLSRAGTGAPRLRPGSSAHRFRQRLSRGFTATGIIVVVALSPATRALANTPGSHRVERLKAVSYQAIDGHTETLVPWQGQQVSVLVEEGVHRSPRVMQRLVSALDAAYIYYANTTGQLPTPFHSLNGRDEIAEVTSTCGAGCSYLGATGIEIQTQFFETLYNQVAQGNVFDQVPFYELGRNFWFWFPQLAFHSPDLDPVVTGFAVWMRFRSMDAAGVAGAPFNGIPFETFRSQVEGLIGIYEADPSLTFAGTLAVDTSPGPYSGTDFWASIMMQLAVRHGDQGFVQRFWHTATTLPTATTTTEAVTNWVQAASAAACVDLSPVFYDRWGFPRPDGTTTPRPPAATVPEPVGQC
jgi:hypothetical protein